MKSINKILNRVYYVLLLVLIISSCEKKTTTEISDNKIVEIITNNMDFQMSDTIFSGWNTIRYKNLSSQTHFVLIDQYPPGKTSKDAEEFVAPVFDKAMKLISEGKTEEGYAEFANLPVWFSEVKFVGGVGLLSPNETGETTINLKPGKYMLECYLKMSNGMFHTSMGMTKDIVVIEKSTGNDPPVANVHIELSSTEGIVMSTAPKKGGNIISVYFKDQIAHENFVGHDINIVKLESNANLETLEMWMNWADPKGLIEPAPENIIFLGGINDLPQGNTGYFTVNLEPGNYAFISEVPNASSKNLLKTFTIE